MVCLLRTSLIVAVVAVFTCLCHAFPTQTTNDSIKQVAKRALPSSLLSSSGVQPRAMTRNGRTSEAPDREKLKELSRSVASLLHESPALRDMLREEQAKLAPSTTTTTTKAPKKIIPRLRLLLFFNKVVDVLVNGFLIFAV